jgi:hypothetical protein
MSVVATRGPNAGHAYPVVGLVIFKLVAPPLQLGGVGSCNTQFLRE